MDRFDRRLRAELHEEFDAQSVDTPPPHRARYSRLRDPARRAVPLRTAALVTAVFAMGVLAGLVYDARHAVLPGPRHTLGAGASTLPSTRTAGVTPAPPASRPSARASGGPTGRPPASAPQGTPPPAPAPPDFADDFSADPLGTGPPAGWQVDDGGWAGIVDDGGHVVRHAGEPLAHLAAGSPRWSDYTVGADVTTALLDLGFAGVAARYRDPGDDYECGVGGVAGQLQLWVSQGGSRRLLAASSASLDLGSRHRVVLQLRGSQLTCSLDGSVVVQATDATLGTGRIALVASSGEVAEFGAVKVTS